jgi:beta-N-acetylhexosaminidase
VSERAVIYGFEGYNLTETERAFFKDINPWGYILFARNIETPQQVKTLTNSLRDLSGRDILPILVDQEGGRVSRFKDPHWRKAPATSIFGEIYDRNQTEGVEAARLNSRLMAHDLFEVGVSIDCLPMLDVRASGSDESVIGDRAYSDQPETVAILGRAAAEGLMDGGILPVLKHLPGHGRSLIDSHAGLPVVEASLRALEASDFRPFRALREFPMGMTGHLIYKSIDGNNPSTLSRVVIEEVIRSKAPGRIGFNGLLMTDDISMGALEGSFEERARKSLTAGCDVILHCNGEMAEMQSIASQTPILSGKARQRADKVIKAFCEPDDFDVDEGRNRLQRFIMGN